MTERDATILIVDDEPITRAGLHAVIADLAGFRVCGEAIDAADARGEVDRKKPDVVIVDIAIEGDHGMAFVETAGERSAVLVFSLLEEMIYAERCVKAGARGFVSKREPVEKLSAAIEAVHRGEVHLSEKVNQRLLRRVAIGSEPASRGGVDLLSDRELQVFQYLGEGLTTNEIAQHISLSPKTVQTYQAKIKHTLRLENANQLIRRAVHYVLQGR